jgi:hypothetical protein
VNRTIYISKADETLWARAEEVAKAGQLRGRSTSLSKMLVQGLALVLAQDDVVSSDVPAPTDRVVVELDDPARLVGFRGGWLIEPDTDDLGNRWGVAVTAGNRLALYHQAPGGPRRLDVVETAQGALALVQSGQAAIPMWGVEKARHLLKHRTIEWLEV